VAKKVAKGLKSGGKTLKMGQNLPFKVKLWQNQVKVCVFVGFLVPFKGLVFLFFPLYHKLRTGIIFKGVFLC